MNPPSPRLGRRREGDEVRARAVAPSIDGASCTAATARSVCSTSSSTSSATSSMRSPTGATSHGERAGASTADIRCRAALVSPNGRSSTSMASTSITPLTARSDSTLTCATDVVACSARRRRRARRRRARRGADRAPGPPGPVAPTVGRDHPSAGEQLVAALELLDGDGDVALLQCRRPAAGPLAVAQVAVAWTMATTRRGWRRRRECRARRRSAARNDGPGAHARGRW